VIMPLQEAVGPTDYKCVVDVKHNIWQDYKLRHKDFQDTSKQLYDNAACKQFIQAEN